MQSAGATPGRASLPPPAPPGEEPTTTNPTYPRVYTENMAPYVPLGYASVSIEHWLTGYNRPAVCTWAVNNSAAMLDPDELAAEQSTAYRTTIGTQVDSTVTIRDCRVLVGQGSGDPLIGFSTLTSPGGRSAESTPPSLALMISKRTALGGRRNRGRFYVPWAVADTAVAENGSISGAVVNTWQTQANAFMTYLSVTNETPMVLLHEGTPPDVPAPTTVTNLSVDGTIRTQRRRQVRY